MKIKLDDVNKFHLIAEDGLEEKILHRWEHAIIDKTEMKIDGYLDVDLLIRDMK